MKEALFKIAIALLVFAGGAFAIYLFVAGYLFAFGAWLPSPWNILVGVVLGAMLLILVSSIFISERPKKGTSH